MLALTRRQSTEAREECWHIYYGDVHAGTIAIRTGIPHDEDPWGWICGFYPGSEPGEQSTGAGTGAAFEEARTAFDEAWRIFLLGASFFCQSELRPTFRRGATRATGPNGSMRCGRAVRGSHRRNPAR